jgi:hypothetical protein
MKPVQHHPSNVRKRKILRGKMAHKLVMYFMPLLIIPLATSVTMTVADTSHSTKTPKAGQIMQQGFTNEVMHLHRQMNLSEFGLSQEVFEKALVGYLNMKDKGLLSDKGLLTVVDFQKSSTQKRIWVLDMKNKKVLYNTYVAHGRGSGEEYAEQFSNEAQSFMSSLGFYVTQEPYEGKHGVSLKINGLDDNYNTAALERNVVVHGADYVSEAFIKARGRLGLSHGCPALPVTQTQEIIDLIKGGTAMYLYYPDANYQSALLNEQVAVKRFFEDNRQI